MNHYDTCDSKNTKLLYTCVCTRAREESRTHHFIFLTRCIHSSFSLIKIPSSPTFFFTSSRCLLVHFRLSTKRRLVFHKTTSHFSQNDGSFFANDGSFFLQNKTHAALLQNIRTFIVWANHPTVSIFHLVNTRKKTDV